MKRKKVSVRLCFNDAVVVEIEGMASNSLELTTEIIDLLRRHYPMSGVRSGIQGYEQRQMLHNQANQLTGRLLRW